MKLNKSYLAFAAVTAFFAAACSDIATTPKGPGGSSYVRNTTNTVTFVGQGFIADGFGGYDLITEICDGNINGILENGADAEGPYLLWVLTATGATSASITGPWGTAAMTPSGNGTFKYVSGWYSPPSLVALPVTATYVGRVTNAQLVVSHGCRPFLDRQGAWCSPGFWGRATDAAWTLANVDRATATFGGTVAIDANFVATNSAAVTADSPVLLQTILTNASTYSGPNIGSFYGWDANAFNLSGAWLTDQIPGYKFDPLFVQDDDSQTCPIDHSGNYKVISQ